MVNYSKFEAIVQAQVEDSHETTQHVLTLLDLMILLPPREEFPVPSSRASTTRHPPLDWASFIRFQMATDARDFIKCLRMPLEAFECLHKMLKVDIRRNKEMAQRRGDYVCTELRLYATLRYLGGGSVHDIRRALKTKKTSTYAIINQVCQAIIQCPALQLKFPQTQIECQEAAMGFRSISHDEAIDNCVAAIDGYLLHTEQPAKRIVGNQRQYYSGHYKKFGINIQAACDHQSVFTYFALAGPGASNDKVAIEQCSLGKLIDNLPEGFCAIGDAAYDPTERLTPIFYGVSQETPLYDNFNFFASQLRIRIEMAFGLMQMKWRLLLCPQQVTRNTPSFAVAISRLHNFVVMYQIKQQGSTHADIMRELQDTIQGTISGVRHSQPVDSQGQQLMYVEDGNTARIRLPKGHSVLRHAMALKIQRKGLERPLQNRITNRENID